MCCATFIQDIHISIHTKANLWPWPLTHDLGKFINMGITTASVCSIFENNKSSVFWVTEFIPFIPKAIYIEMHKICSSSKFLNFSQKLTYDKQPTKEHFQNKFYVFNLTKQNVVRNENF